jgi:hypothetical protein
MALSTAMKVRLTLAHWLLQTTCKMTIGGVSQMGHAAFFSETEVG